MTTASAHGPSLRPVIGICAAYEVASWGAWTMDAGIIASTYLTHLAHSDAVPLALVPSEATIAEAETIVSRLDGLLLLGGADVSPEFYGAVAVPELEATIPFRDRTEIALVHAAMAIDIPIFGVCRGLHLLNVATGGTLRQDIGDLAPQRHRLRRIVSSVATTGRTFEAKSAHEADEGLRELREVWEARVAELIVEPASDAETRLTKRRDAAESKAGHLTLHYVDLDILADELASFGPEVLVVSPPELALAVRDRLRIVAAAHDSSAGGSRA